MNATALNVDAIRWPVPARTRAERVAAVRDGCRLCARRRPRYQLLALLYQRKSMPRRGARVRVLCGQPTTQLVSHSRMRACFAQFKKARSRNPAPLSRRSRMACYLAAAFEPSPQKAGPLIEGYSVTALAAAVRLS